MPRINIFEFEDFAWFPSILRNYATDFLQFLANAGNMYRGVVPILKKGLESINSKKVIDLASGGGGGWLSLSKDLKKEIPGLKVTFTDYFPNIKAFQRSTALDNCFDYVEKPVDALHVPEALKGLRTMFLSLHHFNPENARQILQNAVDAQQPIAVFEGQERSFPSLLAMFFSPFTLLLMTPFIRPFSFLRLVFTYIIPIMPLFVWWDGMASSLRTYSIKEMNEMVASLNNSSSFDWEIGKKGMILYLLGTPKSGSN